MQEKQILINIAEYYKRNDLAVPVDLLARLLEAGVDIRNFK